MGGEQGARPPQGRGSSVGFRLPPPQLSFSRTALLAGKYEKSCLETEVGLWDVLELKGPRRSQKRRLSVCRVGSRPHTLEFLPGRSSRHTWALVSSP